MTRPAQPRQNTGTAPGMAITGRRTEQALRPRADPDARPRTRVSAARSRRLPTERRPRAAAARQALGLCEAELLTSTGDTACAPYSSHGQQPSIRVATTRAALRAAGVPPRTAAALRSRLRLIPEQEAE
jgi:hypothetical protein